MNPQFKNEDYLMYVPGANVGEKMTPILLYDPRQNPKDIPYIARLAGIQGFEFVPGTSLLNPLKGVNRLSQLHFPNMHYSGNAFVYGSDHRIGLPDNDGEYMKYTRAKRSLEEMITAKEEEEYERAMPRPEQFLTFKDSPQLLLNKRRAPNPMPQFYDLLAYFKEFKYVAPSSRYPRRETNDVGDNDENYQAIDATDEFLGMKEFRDKRSMDKIMVIDQKTGKSKVSSRKEKMKKSIPIANLPILTETMRLGTANSDALAPENYATGTQNPLNDGSESKNLIYDVSVTESSTSDVFSSQGIESSTTIQIAAKGSDDENVLSTMNENSVPDMPESVNYIKDIYVPEALRTQIIELNYPETKGTSGLIELNDSVTKGLRTGKLESSISSTVESATPTSIPPETEPPNTSPEIIKEVNQNSVEEYNDTIPAFLDQNSKRILQEIMEENLKSYMKMIQKTSKSVHQNLPAVQKTRNAESESTTTNTLMKTFTELLISKTKKPKLNGNKPRRDDHLSKDNIKQTNVVILDDEYYEQLIEKLHREGQLIILRNPRDKKPAKKRQVLAEQKKPRRKRQTVIEPKKIKVDGSMAEQVYRVVEDLAGPERKVKRTTTMKPIHADDGTVGKSFFTNDDGFVQENFHWLLPLTGSHMNIPDPPEEVAAHDRKPHPRPPIFHPTEPPTE